MPAAPAARDPEHGGRPQHRAGRHGPDTAHRAATRARAIIDAGPRTEMVGAAEFLHALLRVPAAATTPAGPAPAE